MDGDAGEDGKQERHLVLAHKLFPLSHPVVDDLSKAALRAEVLDTVKSDDMATLFESLVTAGVQADAALLAEMRGRIYEEIRKLDENVDFPPAYRNWNWDATDPMDLFEATVLRSECNPKDLQECLSRTLLQQSRSRSGSPQTGGCRDGA